MRYFKTYKRIIATQEKSNGNESVGDMWTETKTFSKTDTIESVIEWAKNCGGRLTITIDEDSTLDEAINKL